MTPLQIYLAQFIFTVTVPASLLSASMLALVVYIKAVKLLRKAF